LYDLQRASELQLPHRSSCVWFCSATDRIVTPPIALDPTYRNLFDSTRTTEHRPLLFLALQAIDRDLEESTASQTPAGLLNTSTVSISRTPQELITE